MASEDIYQLEGRDHVRLRPGMYIGSTENCDALLAEIVGNSMDELYSDKVPGVPCDSMWINFKDGIYTIADNCRGIPIKESPQKKGFTMARLAVSTLNAGSKFNKTRIAVGQNGVGSSATNFLSEEFSILARVCIQDPKLLPKKLRDNLPEVTPGLYYYCSFKKGNFDSEGFKEIPTDQFGGQYPSTITTFKPDLEIMKSPRAKLPSALLYLNFILKNRGREAHIYVNGKEYTDSIESYGMDIKTTIKSQEEDSKNPEVEFLITLGFTGKLEPVEITGSVNGLSCREGFHIRWVRNAFRRAFSEMFSDCGETCLMGLRMCIIALCNEPAFSSQTKEKLSDIEGFSYSKAYEVNSLAKSFKALMKKNYDLFKNHELKILEYMKSTEKLGRKEFIKSTVLIASQSSRSDAMVPEKLIDCSSTNRRECELYLCFTGDTEVLDCNNNRIRFDELSERIKSGEEIYTFSCDSEGYKSPSKIVKCRESKKVNKLVRVTLDNGESFKSTLDHKIMMKDGTYKEAQDLKVGDSCMSIHIPEAELELNKNHKVESVEFLDVDSEPVYCLTVDNELHNFPLACGIFVKNCEGNSAGGSLVKCRDPRIHAVLPLRGKVLNTAGLEIEQVLTNREMKDLISAIGVGVNDYHDMSEVRYGKVIIVADSDPDGLNIDALCLGALATHLTFLVEAGCVYVARSPLFKQGDKYYLDGSELDRTKPYSRFKGLGEANPEDLAPFVFDKNTRELIKITMDNWEDARDMLTSASAKREVMYQHNVISEERVEYQR